MAAIFEGASAKVREAGGTLAGGHTIRDPEPKYGLAVIGAAHPDRLLRKGGARPGDVLLLTKRLGTGLLVSAATARAGRRPADLATAIDQMRTLNRAASEVLVAHRRRGGDRRHGLRPAGPRPRDGAGVRHAVRVRGRGAAGPARRARARAGRRRDRRRRAQPPVRPDACAIGPNVRDPSSSRSPTIRRRAAACWRRSPAAIELGPRRVRGAAGDGRCRLPGAIGAVESGAGREPPLSRYDPASDLRRHRPRRGSPRASISTVGTVLQEGGVERESRESCARGRGRDEPARISPPRARSSRSSSPIEPAERSPSRRSPGCAARA